MNDDTKDKRERFEKWHKSSYGDLPSVSNTSAAYNANEMANIAWAAWQAALAPAQAQRTESAANAAAIRAANVEIEWQQTLVKDATERADALQAKVEAAELDAKRYRWLQKHFRIFSLDMGGNHSYCLTRWPNEARGPTLSAAIDAAMGADK